MSIEVNIAASTSWPVREPATSKESRPEPVAAVPLSGSQVQDSREALEEMVSDINNFVQNVNRELQFTVDEDVGETVITVIDKSNDEVIRKIPSDEMLALRKNMDEMIGLMFSEKT